MRVRLKADGRLVEITSEGQERVLPVAMPEQVVAAPTGASAPDAANARRIRSQTRLTQAEFAARIGVPIETVRNWEQGKRAPRGPARALLKLLDHAPDVAFSVLGLLGFIAAILFTRIDASKRVYDAEPAGA